MTSIPGSATVVLDPHRPTSYDVQEDLGAHVATVDLPVVVQVNEAMADRILQIRSYEAEALFALANMIERAAGRLATAIEWARDDSAGAA